MYINDCNGGYEVGDDYLAGVSNISDIEEILDIMGDLKVVYKNGKILYYENIYGSWGFPKEFKCGSIFDGVCR